MSWPGNPLVLSKSLLSRGMVLPLCEVCRATSIRHSKITFDTHSSPELGTSGPPMAWYKVRVSFDIPTLNNRQNKNPKKSSKNIPNLTQVGLKESKQLPLLAPQVSLEIQLVHHSQLREAPAPHNHSCLLEAAIAA